jgi:diguanylate cyclase
MQDRNDETPPQRPADIARDATGMAGARQARLLRDMLVRTWSVPIMSMLQARPDYLAQAEDLVDSLKSARTGHELAAIDAQLRQLCFKLDFKGVDTAAENELLLGLLRLLLENMGELIDDDSWLSGQLAGVRATLDGPVDREALAAINRNLKEVIYKQGLVKHNLGDAKATLKRMIVTFVDRLDAFTQTAGAYRDKIDVYVRQAGTARSVADLNKVLEQVMSDTRNAQADAVRAREQMDAVRDEVRSAEARVSQLESELRRMSERVYEDHLTGAFNRRGLDDALERALARAERRDLPLCIVMLDLDDFERLGDSAVVHLVQVLRGTLRAMDVVARFGGGEFAIVLPDTGLADAAKTVSRLQRELSRRIFMHEHQRVPMTFSAGVALRARGEHQATLLKRAGEALHQARQSGKNRVVAAG